VNVVWTGRTFEHLEPFVSSQLAHSSARYRFLANACPADQVAALERFAAAHPGRVVEVHVVSMDRMVRHGDVLDEVLASRDDGEWFAFADPDIAALGSFLDDLTARLDRCDAITSGKEVWSDGNVRPADHPGVSGEHFFDQDGYVFGSPHLAIYRAGPLRETMDRWGVGFSSAGNDIADRTRGRLEELGRSFWIYDTGKIVNILFQGDGHALIHEEHPSLLHIGGLSHFLAPPSTAPASEGKPPAWGEGPDWGSQAGMADRYAMAQATASVLEALLAGREVGDATSSVPAHLAARVGTVQEALERLVRDHPPMTSITPSPGASA
jgi:hypothetical protein